MGLDFEPDKVETDRVFFHRTVEDSENYSVRIESGGEELVVEEGLSQEDASSILSLLSGASETGSRTKIDYETVAGETESRYGTLKQVDARYEFEGLDQSALRPEGVLGHVIRRLPESLRSVDPLYDSDLEDSATVYIEGTREDLPGLIV